MTVSMDPKAVTAVGVGDGAPEVGDGDGVAEGVGVTDGLGEAVDVAVGVGLGEAPTFCVLGLVGLMVARLSVFALISQPDPMIVVISAAANDLWVIPLVTFILLPLFASANTILYVNER